MGNATPYKGLAPYTEEDAPFFFGREPEQEIIIANLLASRLTLLYGASGVGKSSVLSAGVAHHLKQRARQNLAEHGTPDFVVVVFNMWRNDPIAALTKCVEDSVEQVMEGHTFEHVQGSRNLVQTLQDWSEQIDGELLIVLDQFEDYLLDQLQDDSEGTFTFEFPRAVNSPSLRASFLISIREDALAKLDRFKGRIPQLFSNYLRLEHLNREAARAAIEEPIRQYNILYPSDGEPFNIEPALVEEVLDQVKTEEVMPEARGRSVAQKGRAEAQVETPLLQLVMERLWNEETTRNSHVITLETLHRLGGAISIVRTHLDAKMDELQPGEQEIAARVFKGLVTPSGNKIAHTVADLADEDFAGLPQTQLGPVLEKLASPNIRILRLVPPPPHQPTAQRYEIFHDVLATAILDWRARYREKQEQARAKQLTEEAARLEDQARRQLEKARKITQSSELAATAVSQLPNDPELSVLLAVEAVRLAPTSQAEDALRQSLLELYPLTAQHGHAVDMNNVALNSDGGWVVIEHGDRVARVWEVVPSRRLVELRGHAGPVRYAAFSRDGRWVVTTSTDKTARVWDAATGNSLIELRGHKGTVQSAAFSPHGKWVATASIDRTARVWEVKTGSLVTELRGHTGDVDSVSFSPDWKWVVTASLDKTVRVWEIASGKCLFVLRGHAGPVRSAAFSLDRKRIITASVDETARVWEPAWDEEPRVWDTTKGRVTVLRGHAESVLGAAFLPDGNVVLTVSRAGTARVWEAGTGRSLVELRGRAGVGDISNAALSPDRKFLLTASGKATARLRETATGRTLFELRGHIGGEESSPAFSLDGKSAVTVSKDGRVQIFACEMDIPVGELLTLAREYLSRQLTPEEQKMYLPEQ